MTLKWLSGFGSSPAKNWPQPSFTIWDKINWIGIETTINVIGESRMFDKKTIDSQIDTYVKLLWAYKIWENKRSQTVAYWLDNKFSNSEMTEDWEGVLLETKEDKVFMYPIKFSTWCA